MIRKRVVNKTIFATIAFVALLMGGCNSGASKKVDPKINSEVEEETVQPGSIAQEPSTVPMPLCPQNSTLLFDKSSSMRGYMESTDSRFYGAISTVSLVARVNNCYFYGEKEDDAVTKEVFLQKLNQRDINWSDESDLRLMIGSMVEHLNNGDDLCLLVSDGILSGSNDDIRKSPDRGYNLMHRVDLSNDIKDLLKDQSGKLSALIIRYKSKFNTRTVAGKKVGYYYCFNNDKKEIADQDRPFFVIVLGKWEYVKYFENQLNEELKSSVSTPFENIVMLGDNLAAYGDIKLSYSEGVTVDTKDKERPYIIKTDYKRDGMVCFSADISCLPKYMKTEQYLNDNVGLFIKINPKQNPQKPARAFDKEFWYLTLEKTGETTLMKIYLKASQLSNSEVTFKLYYSFPKWMEEKSDDNDLDILEPMEMDKTFNLKYLVEGFKVLQKEGVIKEQMLKFK